LKRRIFVLAVFGCGYGFILCANPIITLGSKIEGGGFYDCGLEGMKTYYSITDSTIISLCDILVP